MSLTKIGSIGINTGIQFAGVTTVSTLHVGSGVTLSSDGDIFATGISTFSEDIKVGSGVTISPDGDGFYTGVVTATTFSGALAASNLTGALPAISAANLTNVPAANITGTLPAISGANLTNLDASDLASGTVPTARLGSGTASSSTFLRGDSTFQTVNTDLVSDTSPQLGGNLDVNTKNIEFGDSSGVNDDRLKFGASGDLQIYHDSNDSYIHDAGTGHLNILATNFRVRNADSDEIYIVANDDGAVELYHDNSQKFTTSSSGVTISADTSTGSLLKGVTRFCPSGSTTVKAMYDEGGFSGAGHFQVKDGVAFTAGDSSDLKIYHSSNNSYLANDTGYLYIQSDNVSLGAKSAGENMLVANKDGAVSLYYDNSRKFFTNSSGITVESTGNTPKVEFRGASNLDMGKIHVDQFSTNFSAMSFFTMSSGSQVERMRLLDNGNLCVMNDPSVTTANLQSPGQGNGNTAVGVALQEAGRVIANSAGSYSSFGRNDTGLVVSFTRSGGDQGGISVAPGSVSYGSGSDYRLKENVVSLTDGITRIKQLIPKRFNFIEDTTNTLRDGFLAHEVSSIVPEAITGTKDEVDSDNKPVYQQIDQAKLVPLLTAALQEEIAKRESLEARVSALEG